VKEENETPTLISMRKIVEGEICENCPDRKGSKGTTILGGMGKNGKFPGIKKGR